MAETVTLGWGRCLLEVKKLGDPEAQWEAFATPVENSTQLTTTQGDKLEAKVEGGENEAVRYKKNTYQLVANIRQAPERTDPIKSEDGVVADEYAVRVTPEDKKALGVLIDRASVNVQDTFSTEEGAIKIYTFDVLKPESGSAVKIQAISE